MLNFTGNFNFIFCCLKLKSLVLNIQPLITCKSELDPQKTFNPLLVQFLNAISEIICMKYNYNFSVC